jgi:hypothetical protein
VGVLSLIKSFHFVHIAAYGMNYEEEEKVALIQVKKNERSNPFRTYGLYMILQIYKHILIYTYQIVLCFKEKENGRIFIVHYK